MRIAWLTTLLAATAALPVLGMSGGGARAFVLDQPIRDLRILVRCQLIQGG